MYTIDHPILYGGRLCTSWYVHVSNTVHLYIDYRVILISKEDYMELIKF